MYDIYPVLSVRHPGILCADCQKVKTLTPLLLLPLPATPWYRCSHDGHSRDGLHLITGTAQGEESGTEIEGPVLRPDKQENNIDRE